MIDRNTTIPSKKSQIFSTYADNQTAVDIRVLQGERPMAKDNKQLGLFRLDGISAAPRGTPQIEVTFDIDANGILHVSAIDKGTGKKQEISITGSSGLSKDEVEKLRKEAEMHAAEDKVLRETAEARNKLDAYTFQLEKQIKDAGDKLPANAKEEAEKLIAESKKLLDDKASTLDAINAQIAKFDAIMQAAQQAAAQQQAGAADAGTPPPTGDAKKDGPVDADFEVVDDDKK